MPQHRTLPRNGPAAHCAGPHDIQASLASADDAQIAKIVAMVDAMPQRGEADALIAPLRPRLAQLRPARPIGFTRLLFTPVDSLIVTATGWRRGGPAIPRTTLAPIARGLRESLPADAMLIDLQGTAAMTELGATLWPRAATAIGMLELPTDWTEATGLSDSDFPPIVATIQAVLSVAVEMHSLAMPDAPISDDPIRTLLGRTAPRGAAALSAVIAVMLARLPCSGRIIALATEAAGANPARAVDRAVEYALDALQAAVETSAVAGTSTVQAIQDADRVANLLHEMHTNAASRPERKRRIDRIRRDAELLCRGRFEWAIQDEFVDRLDVLPSRPDGQAIVALAASAHALRHLEAAGRRLGGGRHYEALLHHCLAPLQRASGKLRLEDRMHLVEILSGLDEAPAPCASSA
jgi:hypothetical protein